MGGCRRQDNEDEPGNYEFPGGNFRWRNPDGKWVQGYKYPPYEDPGTEFCDSKKGTGVNDSKLREFPDGRKAPKADGATFSECIKQF